MCMDASVQTCPKLLPFALLSACNCSSVVSGHPGRGDHPYCYFTRGTEVQRSRALEELGTGIWTPVVWHLQDFFLFPAFLNTIFPILLLQMCLLPLIFSSLIFSLMHLANSPLTSKHTSSLTVAYLAFSLPMLALLLRLILPELLHLGCFLGMLCAVTISHFSSSIILLHDRQEKSVQ